MAKEHMNVAELKEFRRLEKKLKTPPERRLTDKDLDAMASRGGDIMGASAIEDMGDFWSRWCERFHVLTEDNMRLIREVRWLNERLRELTNGK